jgi:hypothetical protein
MFSYMLFVGVLSIASALQTTVEPWVVRHRLSEADSGGFYFAVLFGSIPAYLGTAVLSFLFPLVSEAHEKSEETRGMLRQAMMGVAIAGLCVVAGFALFGRELLQIRESWRPYIDYAPYIWLMALVSTLDTIISCYISHETACRRFRFLRYYSPMIAAEAVFLYGLMGWGFFQAWMPEPWWKAVNAWPVRNLMFVIGVMLVTRIAVTSVILFSPGIRGPGNRSSPRTVAAD